MISMHIKQKRKFNTRDTNLYFITTKFKGRISFEKVNNHFDKNISLYEHAGIKISICTFTCNI